MDEHVRVWHSAGSVEPGGSYPVIWLASWYPSRTSPFNGDFIQRHARAVSANLPLLVIHTIHDEALQVPVQYELRQTGQLSELLVYFRHGEPAGAFSSVSYNFAFYRHTVALLRHIIRRWGPPNAFHVHVPIKMGRVAQWARMSYGIPYIVSEQSGQYVGNAPDAFVKRNAIHRWWVKQIFRGAATVTNVSETVSGLLQKMFGLREVITIHNLAETALFHYAGKDPSGTFRFLHASTLSFQKNFDGIIRVMDELRKIRTDFELDVLGGAVPAVLQRSWVRELGTVGHDQVAIHMKQADAFVLFSRYENFPCVIVEALCAGLPVVTSDVGGSGEAITGMNGLVVPSENEKALLEALNKIMDDHYDRAAIARDAAAKYGSEQVGHQFLAVYASQGLIT